MAENVGRVEFLVGLDGSRLPAEARLLGKKVGASGDKSGKEFGKQFEAAAGPHLSEFAHDMADQLSGAGKLGGRRLADDFAAVAKKRLQNKRFDVANALFDQHGFDDLVHKFGSVDAAVLHLRESIASLGDEPLLDNKGRFKGMVIARHEMEKLNDTVDEFADNLRNRLTPELKKAGKAGKAAQKDSDGFFDGIKGFLSGRGGLSTGAIIGLVTAAFEPLAVVLSGAAAALSALVASAGAAIAGLTAIAGPAIIGLTWTLLHAVSAAKLMKEEFPAAQKGMDALGKAAENDSRAFARAWGPALAEFTQKLAQLWRDDKMGERAGEALGEVTEAFTRVLKSPAYLNFQTAMETAIPNAIANLGTAAASLTGGLLNIFAAASPSLERLTKKLAKVGETWEKKIQAKFDSGALQDTIDGLVGTFELWLDTIGEIGGALSTFFKAGKASGDRMVRTLGYVFTAWDKWMTSIEGSEALDLFFTGGEELFNTLLEQLPKIGSFFEQVVTPAALERTSHLLDTLGDIVEGPLAALTNIVGALDPFGVIADALLQLSDALGPLKDPMEDLAGGIKDVLEAGIDTLAPIIEDIAEALAPFVQGLADFVKQNPKQVADFLLAISAAFLAIKAVGIAGNITTAIGGFVGKLSPKNITKIDKFAAALGGLALAFAGLAEQNKEGGGLEGGGLGVLETIGGGALTGAAFGPIGVAIGALGGSIASMIQDMFLSPDIEGAWKTGWDQLFDPTDFSGAGIGALKQLFTEQISPAVTEGWETVRGKFELGWQQLADFFTISVPAFFAGLGHLIWDGITAVGTGVTTAWTAVSGAFATGWNQIVTFFTVSVPAFFVGLGKWIWDGLGSIVSGVVTGWETVSGAFEDGWSQIVDYFTVEVPAFFADAGHDILMGVLSLGTKFNEGFQSVWRTVTGWVDDIASKVQEGLSNVPLIGGLFASAAGSVVGAAAGTILRGPRILLAGEAGPEAIVPLRRPLSQVDPSVRALSAFAQGLAVPGRGTGGPGIGRTLNIAEGAIQIVGPDPRRAANEVVTRIVERAV